MHDLHVACAQFAARPGGKTENIARMVSYADQAKGEGCDLVLFPELIVTGYLPPEEVLPLAEPISGPSVEALSRAATKLGIALAFGFAELDEQRGVRHNSLVVLDKLGRVVSVYRKMHLWDREKEWAEGGTNVPVFEICGLRCAGWICYDTRFPEVGRLAALAGAHLCLVPTAWLGPGEEWKLALRARALDNNVFVAGADIINADPGLRCLGLSVIVGPRGNVLAEAAPGEEGIIHALLQERELVEQRGRARLFENRHPELYDGLVH